MAYVVCYWGWKKIWEAKKNHKYVDFLYQSINFAMYYYYNILRGLDILVNKI